MKSRFLQLALGLLLAASSAWAVTWSHAYGVTGSNYSSGTTTVTLGFAPTAGSLLLVACMEGNSTGLTLSITDNSSGPADVWSTIVPLVTGTQQISQAWMTTVTSGTAPSTVTCTHSSGAHQKTVIIDNYTAGNSFSQDGAAASATGYSVHPAVSYTTGTNAGDLLWSYASSQANLTSLSVASPFGMEETYFVTNGSLGSADSGLPSGASSSTQYTATYTANTTVYWTAATVGITTWNARTATPSETHVASDSLARLGTFARGDTETNTASDALGRQANFPRSDTETYTAGDALARVGTFARGDTETSTANDALGRRANFARGDTETYTAGDALARVANFGRGDTETNAVSDALARLGNFARAGAEANAASDALNRAAGYSRAAAERNTAGDTLARMAALYRQNQETAAVSDFLARTLAANRGTAELLAVTDVLNELWTKKLIVLPWRQFAAPGQRTSGTVPAQAKTGSVPVH